MLDPYIDPTMKAKILPAPLIIRNFVRGEAECDYQKYLIELINFSEWFGREHPGIFHAPPSESHGECDAINKNYQLDFKLLASKTKLMSRSILSPQIYIENGVTFFCGSKKADGHVQATRIYAAFRGLTLNDLSEIRNSDVKKYGVENDILEVLKTLETKKNLLLFFPYTFTFEKSHLRDEAIQSITEALNHDFGSALLFRNQYANGYDTFLTCIYDGSFLIYCVCDRSLHLCDTVATSDVKTFTRLLGDYGDWWD